MKLFNTLTRRKEEFVPLEEGKVRMYVCGPTVYNLIHIGNARPMIIFDTVRRYMEYKGYEVNYVSNFTDVDDKIIKKAIEEGVSAQEISERYIAECKKDMDGMNVKPATTNPQATQEIDGMISMIQTLVDKGYAYPAADGTVYFRVKKFKEYGKLSHKNLDDLQSGFRSLQVSGEDQKEDPLDFVLWKPKKEGEPSWPSPWCDGRPGWHIECSVMAKKYLGDEIDIHAGGEDLIFPHHENEIAQSECCNDKIFAKYWMHNAFLNIDNRKMSKSLSNGVAPNKIIEQYGADILRLWVASSDYHADIRISPEILKQLSDAYRKIRNTARFILGNLADFNPDQDKVSFDELLPIDRWALHRFDLVNQKARAGYDAFEFHQVYHAIHNFCVVDMSNFYLDVIKDRLYVEKADSKERRAAQTAMYMILDGMTRLISPILAYTSDEIWQAMKHDASADAENVVLNQMPEPTGVNVDETFIQTWDRIHDIRDAVKKALELARNEKLIRASLDAKVQLFCDGEMYDFVKSVEAELPVVFIVSQVELVKGGKGTFVSEDLPELSVTVLPAEGDKCSRCWTYSNTVGSNEKHPEVCAHCASVLE